MTYYEQNIRKCKDSQDRFLKSQKFLKLSKKWQPVVECIFKTIAASPYLYCNKSNRTISLETGVSTHVINQARLWLEEQGIVRIFRLRNGRRENKKFLLQMVVTSQQLKLSEMTEFEKERFRTIMGLNAEEFTQAKVNDLIQANQYKLQDSKNLKEYKDINNRCGNGVSDCDMEFIEKNSLNKHTKNLLSDKLRIIMCPLDEKIGNLSLQDVNVSNFESLNTHDKALVLESKGFITVPTKNKHLYCGYDSLLTKGKIGRIALHDSIELAGKSSSWADFYKTRMGEVAWERFEDYTFANPVWMSRKKFMARRFDSYQDHKGLAIALKKGMVCIDIDRKDSWYLSIIKALIPGCLIQTTPRGYHVFAQDSHHELAGFQKLGYFVDVKQHRSSVVVSGEGYSFVSGDFDNLPEIPVDFVRRLANCLHVSEIELKEPEGYIPETSAYDPSGKFRTPDYLYVGERNRFCMRFSFHLRAKGFSLDAIETILWNYVHDKERVEQPLTNAEIRGMVRYAAKRKNRSDFIQIIPMFSLDI